MVVQGNFSLQLVNTKTMEPFREHSDYTGKTFVRMEPNVDFFVRLSRTNKADNGDTPISYQTFVSNTTAGVNHSNGFKRRWNPNHHGGRPNLDVYRFERTAPVSTYHQSSVLMEHVTVQVFEEKIQEASAPTSKKRKRDHRHSAPTRSKLLETLTVYCCVHANTTLGSSAEENLLASMPSPSLPLWKSLGFYNQKSSVSSLLAQGRGMKRKKLSMDLSHQGSYNSLDQNTTPDKGADFLVPSTITPLKPRPLVI